MYGSGIFNETSGSCDGDSGYGGFADKAPAAGENQVIFILWLLSNLSKLD